MNKKTTGGRALSYYKRNFTEIFLKMGYNQPMLRDNALKGEVIIITGGGSGLGKAMTTYFLELGARTVITSRNLEKLQKTAEELEKSTGGEVLPLACDVITTGTQWDGLQVPLRKTSKQITKLRFGEYLACPNQLCGHTYKCMYVY